MANMIKIAAAVAADKIADVLETLQGMNIAVTVGGNGEQLADEPEPSAARQTERIRRQLADVSSRIQSRAAAAAAPAVRKTAAATRAAGSPFVQRTVYVATRKAGADKLSPNRAAVLRSIASHPNRGMRWHQDKLDGKIERKTVDGSIFYLAKNGFIRRVDAK